MNYTFKNPSEIGIYSQTRSPKSIAKVQKELNADVICNFQHFSSNGKPDFVLKANGKVLGWDGANYWGIGWNNGDKTFTYDYANNMSRYENFAGCVQILRNGQIIKLQAGVDYPITIGGVRGRTCIGTKADGSIVIYCWPDNSSGACKVEDLGKKMLALGCVNAINFDGGGSTQLICPNGKVTTSRPIYNFLYFKMEQTKPAATTKPTCPYREPILNIRMGSRGEGAKWVQWMLNQHGANLVVDGIFGNLSRTALINFQRKSGLVADAICGAKTRAALKK